MKAKTFIQNLSQRIFEEYREEIPKEGLKVSLVEAIKNISAHKLKDDLNTNFDKFLKRLEKSLRNLCTRELPSISSRVDDSLEELTKSELDGRKDLTEEDGTEYMDEMMYNLMENDPKKPKLSIMKKLNDTQRLLIYRTFLQKVLNRQDVTDTFIQTVIQDFDNICGISEHDEEDVKSKFDWLPMCSLLLELVTGSKPLAFIRVLKVLFESVQKDVDKCLAKEKHVRSGKLANILKKFINISQMNVRKCKLKESERKMYCQYVSALLSFYVELCCIHSSKVVKKKLYGREVAGYVCYILQPWPESCLDVALQLQRLEDNHYNILLPLIIKCMEVKPSGRDHVYYLKYVLLVRQVKDAYGEYEKILAWNLETKEIPAKKGFVDWLSERCPEALEYIPVEDKKFKKTKITRFLLEEAEDDLITMLLDSVSREDEGKTDVPVTEQPAEETDLTMATESLFYLDKDGGSSILELADGQIAELSECKKTSSRQSGSKHKPIVLKTLQDVEKLVDTGVVGDETTSPQTYTLDPEFIMEKVKDPEDRKFLQSEIISITSVSSISKGEESEGSEITVNVDESKITNGSDKSYKWMRSNSSTPNKKQKPNKIQTNASKHETDDSDISAIGKTEGFCDSVTSASEDDGRVKSVVRKVTPRKVKASERSKKNVDVSDVTINNLQDTSAVKGSLEKLNALSTVGIPNRSKDEVDGSEDSVISLDDSDMEVEAKDDIFQQSEDVSTDKANEYASLSSVHESSVEIVDIVLEPKDQSITSNLEGQSVSKDKISIESTNQITESLKKVGSPRKLHKTWSPRQQMSKKSPRSINTSNIGENIMSENSLSCMSGLSTATNYSDTVEIITSDTYESDQNSTWEEPGMNTTAKFVGEKSRGSSSEFVSNTYKDKSRKTSENTLKDGQDFKHSVEDKSNTVASVGKSPNKKSTKKIPKVRVSEMHTESESDEDVFRQASEINIEGQAKSTGSIEEKFIEKAIKGKKTPKRCNGKGEMHVVQEVSSSLSLFTDEVDIDSQCKERENETLEKRTQSTEDIFEIVEEIKEKIKTPRTRKPVSKDKEKLNESIFTSDSVESLNNDSVQSLNNESDITDKEVKSSGKKRILKSDSSDKSSSRKTKSKEINEQVRENSLNNEKSCVPEMKLVKSPKKYATQDKKTPSKGNVTENSESLGEYLVIDLSDDENDNEQHEGKGKSERNESEAELSENTVPCKKLNISTTKSEKDDSELSGNLEPISSSQLPREKSPLKMKEKRTPNKTTSGENSSKLKSASGAVKLASEIAEQSSPETPEHSNTNGKTEFFVSNTLDKKQVTQKCESPISHSKKGSEDNEIDIVSESETESELGMRNRTPKGKLYEDNSVEMKIKSKTPQSAKRKNTNERKEKVRTPKGSTMKTPEGKTVKTPTSEGKTVQSPEGKTWKSPEGKAVKIPEVKTVKTPEGKTVETPEGKTVKTQEGKTGETPTPKGKKLKTSKTPEGETVKTPEGKRDKFVQEKSDSKKSLERTGNTTLVKTPKSVKQKCTPAKSDSAIKNKSPSLRQTEGEIPSDSGDDFVPSSEKKSRIDTNGKKEAGFLPDISVHLKPESTKSKAVDNKSPHISSSLDTNKKNESTPQKGRRISLRSKHSPDQSTDPDKDETKKRVTRKSVLDSEKESDVEGPTHPKRLRSTTSDLAETASTKGRTKSKTDIDKLYDYHSESDILADRLELKRRRSRKSEGSQGLTAIKDKILASVEEEPVKNVNTPPSKVTRQRKGSASTTKKAMQKLELRPTRKRRLSGELSGQSSRGNESTDSEIAFPKVKSVVAADKKAKGLSTSVVPSKKEPESGASGRRYSLRKK